MSASSVLGTELISERCSDLTADMAARYAHRRSIEHAPLFKGGLVLLRV